MAFSRLCCGIFLLCCLSAFMLPCNCQSVDDSQPQTESKWLEEAPTEATRNDVEATTKSDKVENESLPALVSTNQEFGGNGGSSIVSTLLKSFIAALPNLSGVRVTERLIDEHCSITLVSEKIPPSKLLVTITADGYIVMEESEIKQEAFLGIRRIRRLKLGHLGECAYNTARRVDTGDESKLEFVTDRSTEESAVEEGSTDNAIEEDSMDNTVEDELNEERQCGGVTSGCSGDCDLEDDDDCIGACDSKGDENEMDDDIEEEQQWENSVDTTDSEATNAADFDESF